MPLLQRKGIETIIVLLHEGGSAGQALNETTINTCGNPSGPIVDVVQRFDPAIDLVVTGHTNWALNCSDFAGTGIMVTGAASVGRLVTDVDLSIDRRTKDVVGATINNVIVRRDAKPAAADITALINKYGEIAAPIENRVLGTASATLTRGRTRPVSHRSATSSPTPSSGPPRGLTGIPRTARRPWSRS